MKPLIILITLIAIQTICLAQKRQVTIDVKIDLTGQWLRIDLNDQKLSLIELHRRKEKPTVKTVALSKLQSNKIWGLLEKVNKKEWSGYWINYNVLDGYEFETNLQLNKQKLNFKGSNSYPKDFVQIINLIAEASNDKMLNELSKGLGFYDPKHNRQFKSFNDFVETMAKE